MVIASRKPEACAETEKALREAGIDAAGIACHMGSLDDIRALVTSTLERFGAINIVVDQRGKRTDRADWCIYRAGIHEVDGCQPQRSCLFNPRGPSVLPRLRSCFRHQRGVCWRLAVLLAGGPLCRAKSAMVSYTKSIAAGLALEGIRVNALAPGTVDTDMVRATAPRRAPHGQGGPAETGCDGGGDDRAGPVPRL